MSYPNEHTLIINDISKYKSFNRINKKYGLGIDAVYGVNNDGDTELQSVRFNKSYYNIKKVEKWLVENPELKGEIKKATNDSTTVMRFDNLNIDNKFKETKEGYLRIDAPVTRVGVFTYRNLDGSSRRELRHPDHVFKIDSLNSMKQIPITNNHPIERRIDSTTMKKYSIGTTGDNIKIDGEYIKASFTINDSLGVKAVKQGRKQLSCGYETALIQNSGTYKGENYDCIQTEISYNHVAICDNARGGSQLRINIDSYDNQDGYLIENKKQNINKKKGVIMPTLRIDNVDYEAAQQVINDYNRQVEKCDNLSKEIETQKKVAVKVVAERDTIKAEFEKFKTDSKKDISNMIKTRIAIEKLASKVFEGDKDINIDSMSNIEIKKAIIIKSFPDLSDKIDDADENYINASYDITIQNLDSSKKTNISKQRKVVKKQKNTDDERTSADARNDMIDRMVNPEKYDKSQGN